MSAQQHLSAIIAAVAARSGYSVTVGTLERLRDEIDADIAAAIAATGPLLDRKSVV